jgi:D-aminoacyl-tRNA deacylase
MRAVLQRVSSARVVVNGNAIGSIQHGLLVLLGVSITDTSPDADYLLNKITGLRIFPDESGKMNRNVTEAGGALLVVSQFTLYADCRKGRRPSFDRAAPPEQARALYEYFVQAARHGPVAVHTGLFQASMEVELVNTGPVTIILDSSDRPAT